jgi:hypothetical protein
MVSANESGFYLRETSLLSHNILSTGGMVTAGDVGQRTNLDVSRLLKGYCVCRLEQATQFTLLPFGIPQRAAWVVQLTDT